MRKPFVLVICDGWGERDEAAGNAIAAAQTPCWDAIRNTWPHTTVEASGSAVGLPAGQQGNSEVGHLTIGAGRVIHQPLSRQHLEIDSGSFYQNEVLIQAIEIAKERNSALHIIGLISPGGVHSHQNGAVAMTRLAADLGMDRVHIHAFTDGRDTPPASAHEHIQELEAELAAIGAGRVASISGRYYAMDRDNRWERTQTAYDMLTGDDHPIAPNAVEHVRGKYDEGVTDEFIRPVAIAATPEDRTRVEDDDVVVFFNFRPDRARQLSHALVDKEFSGFERRRVVKNLHFVSFAEYDSDLEVPIAFPKDDVQETLAEVVSTVGLKQYHLAETEKYAHVTYFLNGGREDAFPGEEREMITSTKVATYDLEPAMSAAEVTDAAVKRIARGIDDLIVMNYANADMVGHTGIFPAIVSSIETLDGCLGRLVDETLKAGGAVLITADHGNAEYKIDKDSGEPLTSHTTNPVPVVLCGTDVKALRVDGGLQDIAPTVLSTLGLDVPAKMTGTSLITE
ncbi:MAG TPA: 2,3-bisphosphoglycerate-independent phosphoglycerate mutase [Candidatus Saccharimonadales bacterium]|jgi:2,3-bisphosphoglycerate-independent phosphoglycerate mutase